MPFPPSVPAFTLDHVGWYIVCLLREIKKVQGTGACQTPPPHRHNAVASTHNNDFESLKLWESYTLESRLRHCRIR